MINFFLEEENKVHKEELVSLVKLDTPEADIKILVRPLSFPSFVYDIDRLPPLFPFCRLS
jgi:hypothetical protein